MIKAVPGKGGWRTYSVSFGSFRASQISQQLLNLPEKTQLSFIPLAVINGRHVLPDGHRPEAR